MTTLADAQLELHHLAERQATLRLRIRKGELVERFRLLNVSVTVGHRHRDLILAAPVRWAATLAAEQGLDPRALLRELDRILHAELTAHARSRALARGDRGG